MPWPVGNKPELTQSGILNSQNGPIIVEVSKAGNTDISLVQFFGDVSASVGAPSENALCRSCPTGLIIDQCPSAPLLMDSWHCFVSLEGALRVTCPDIGHVGKSRG